MSYYEVSDFVAECYGINAAIGGFTKRIIDENKDGQCMIDVAKILEDMNVMMHRYSTDGDSSIAKNPITHKSVQVIMEFYLNKRIEQIQQLDNARAH